MEINNCTKVILIVEWKKLKLLKNKKKKKNVQHSVVSLYILHAYMST